MMQTKIKWFYLIMLLLVIDVGTMLAQNQDTTATTRQQPRRAGPSSNVLDFSGEAVRIKAEAEKPRVNIFTERIVPEFDEINLEKSFLPELSGAGEKIILLDADLNNKLNSEVIEVDKVVNRKR